MPGRPDSGAGGNKEGTELGRKIVDVFAAVRDGPEDGGSAPDDVTTDSDGGWKCETAKELGVRGAAGSGEAE